MTHILVVDDEKNIRITMPALLKSYCKRLGKPCEVSIAEDGSKALELLNANGSSIDAVVSDINMLKVDGFKVYDTAVEKKLPCVLMTGDYKRNMEGLKQRNITKDEILYKPFGKKELTWLIERLENSK
jgi:CheY-like chemotaxis protein